MSQRVAVITALIFLLAANLTVATAQTARHVAAKIPVVGPGVELSADREAGPGVATPLAAPAGHAWKKISAVPGAIIHDISFPTVLTGYAAAELGQVWKTTDGGAHWREIVNIGFPYYWFGVKALSVKDVVIAGFNDQSFQGIIRWSHDGGQTWTPDLLMTSTGWSYRVRFANQRDGLVMDGVNLQSPNSAHYTVDGGTGESDWTSVVPDPNGGWFGNQFSLLPNLHARASGITYCFSANGGAAWSCGPSIDSIFDGPVFFVNDKVGWVGGGEIAPNVEGWVHRTVDGGQTWGGRTLDGPWPIREIRFLNQNIGWAAGGNVFTGVGGIYFSGNGGQKWALDLNTGAEMDACDAKIINQNYQVWCAGYDASFNGVVYTLKGKLAQ